MEADLSRPGKACWLAGSRAVRPACGSRGSQGSGISAPGHRAEPVGRDSTVDRGAKADSRAFGKSRQFDDGPQDARKTPEFRISRRQSWAVTTHQSKAG